MVSAQQPPGQTGCSDRGQHSLSGSELLAWRRSLLAEHGGGAGAAAGIDWLLDLAGGIGWSALQSLWLHPQRRVWLSRPLEELEDLWRRHRHNAEPLQYLVGRCPWRDLELAVAPGVLIPRQETEQLAELALQLAPRPAAGMPLRWADLGTGSGCLALALARGLHGSQGLAVEASAEALRQAEANLRALLPVGSCLDRSSSGDHPDHWGDAIGPAAASASPATPIPDGSTAARSMPATVRLLQGNWWQAIEPWWGQLHLVVSNPPYIPTATLATLDPVVRDHEPALALDGGADGLAAIDAIVAGAPMALVPGGVLLLEHHHDQSDAVLERLAAAGLVDCRAHRDLEGVRRFASARRDAGGTADGSDLASIQSIVQAQGPAGSSRGGAGLPGIAPAPFARSGIRASARSRRLKPTASESRGAQVGSGSGLASIQSIIHAQGPAGSARGGAGLPGIAPAPFARSGILGLPRGLTTAAAAPTAALPPSGLTEPQVELVSNDGPVADSWPGRNNHSVREQDCLRSRRDDSACPSPAARRGSAGQGCTWLPPSPACKVVP